MTSRIGRALDAVRQRSTSTTNAIDPGLRYWVLAACLTVQFTSALTVTIVGTAAPTVAEELHGVELYGWIFTAYLLASACTVPIVGRLSDAFGRRPFFLGGLGFFLVGSALAGLAQNMTELIGARVISGIGGGCLLVLVSVVLGDIFSPRERGRWQGVVMTVWGTGQIGGPLIGGLVTDHLGWRWVFYLNLPPGLVAFALLFLLLPSLRRRGTASVDWSGLVLVLMAVIPFQLALTWGGSTYAWSSPIVIGLLVSGLAAGIAFAVNESRTDNAFVSPRLFANGVFRGVVILAILGGVTLYSSQGFLPLYGQAVLGLSAAESGLLFSPFILMFMTGSTVAGIVVSRTGRYKTQLTVGALLITIGSLAMTTMDRHSGIVFAAAAFLALGLGAGLTLPVSNVVAQSAFPYRMLGTVTSARQFLIGISSITSISVMTAVLLSGLVSDLGQRLGTTAGVLTPGGDAPTDLLTTHGQQALARALPSSSPAEVGRVVDAMRDAAATGIHNVFLLILAVALVGLVASRLLPEVALRTTVDDEGSIAIARS